MSPGNESLPVDLDYKLMSMTLSPRLDQVGAAPSGEIRTFLCDTDGATAHTDPQTVHTRIYQVLGLCRRHN